MNDIIPSEWSRWEKIKDFIHWQIIRRIKNTIRKIRGTYYVKSKPLCAPTPKCKECDIEVDCGGQELRSK